MRYRIRAGATTVAIDGATICEPEGRFDVSLSIDEGLAHPGLINAHDHLHRNHYPRLGSPPYADAYEWGHDIHARFADAIATARSVPRRAALLYGALKNLVAGVTTVVHHDAWEADFDHDFPIRVARLRTLHSLGFDAAAVHAEARAVADRSGDGATAPLPLAIHLAEGTNAAAAEECRALAALGLLDDRLLAVHAVGVDPDGIRRILAAGSAIVWCPRSNFFLFGRTAPGRLLAASDVLIGSDSGLTAPGTLLDEIRMARRLRILEDTRILDAVGRTAARRLDLPEPRLEPGSPADVVILRRPLLEATPADVALVLVAGRPQLADPGFSILFEPFRVPVRRLPRHDSPRFVPVEVADAADACRRPARPHHPEARRSEKAHAP